MLRPCSAPSPASFSPGPLVGEVGSTTQRWGRIAILPGDMGDIAEDEALEIPPEAPHGVAQLFFSSKKCPEKRQEDEVQIVQPKPVPQALDEFTGCLLWGMKFLHERQLRIV